MTRIATVALEERNRLVLCNLGLVHRVVQRLPGWLVRRGGGYEDCVQFGVGALIRAAELFDPGRGLRFSTYATTAVKRTLYRQCHRDGLIRLPVSVCDPTRPATRRYAREIRAARHLLALDGVALRLSAREVSGHEEAEAQAVLRARLRVALRSLTSRVRQAVRLRYLEGCAWAEVRAALGCSKTRCEQLVERGLLRLAEVLGEDARDDFRGA